MPAADLERERIRANVLRNARRADWSPATRDAANAKTAEWRDANRERHRQLSRDWYAANADHARALKLAAYYADKSKFFARNFLRKARRRAAICEHGEGCVTADFLSEQVYSRPCFYCGGETTDADHFMPLASGGLHCQTNLVPACGPCNGSKHARDPIEFLVGVRGDQ